MGVILSLSKGGAQACPPWFDYAQHDTLAQCRLHTLRIDLRLYQLG